MTQLHDVANALVEAQRQAPFWGGDASKFILMGHSAGGHLISFIASDANFALRKGAMPWLGSIILDSGALNVPSLMSEFHFSLFDDAFGNDSKYWIKISPIHQLKTQTAPILLVSSARRGVSVNQAEEYYKKTINLGTKAMHLSLNLSHREINVNLGLDNDYTKNVDEFIKSMQ
jgi:acetyl esterase/lipase